jgi:hypothetical protein
MANKLLGARGGELVGKHWAERFVTRSDELKMQSCQQAKQTKFPGQFELINPNILIALT